MAKERSAATIMNELANHVETYWPKYTDLKEEVDPSTIKGMNLIEADQKKIDLFRELKHRVSTRPLYSKKIAKINNINIDKFVYRASCRYFNKEHIETSGLPNWQKRQLKKQLLTFFEQFNILEASDNFDITNIAHNGILYRISYIDLQKLREEIARKREVADNQVKIGELHE